MTAFFDTHDSVKKLKDAGFTEQQAEAQVQLLAGILQSNLATKRDIEVLRLATKADIAELRTELKTDIADVRTEIERMGRVVIMWMVGLAIGAMAAMTGILIAIIRAMVPGA